MNTKANSLLTVAALLVSIGCWLSLQTSRIDVAETMMHGSMALAQLSALYLLVRSGTFIKSLYWITWCTSLILLAIGVLFQLMHWQGAGFITLLALAATAMVYSVSFMFKRDKSPLDVLKVIWVLSYSGYQVAILRHLVAYNQGLFWQNTNLVLFWTMVTTFGIIQYRKQKAREAMA